MARSVAEIHGVEAHYPECSRFDKEWQHYSNIYGGAWVDSILRGLSGLPV